MTLEQMAKQVVNGKANNSNAASVATATATAPAQSVVAEPLAIPAAKPTIEQLQAQMELLQAALKQAKTDSKKKEKKTTTPAEFLASAPITIVIEGVEYELHPKQLNTGTLAYVGDIAKGINGFDITTGYKSTLSLYLSGSKNWK